MTDELIKRAEWWLKNIGHHELIQDLLTALKGKGWMPIESADKEQIEQILLYNGEYNVGGWANDRIGIGSEYLGYTGEGWYTDNWQKIDNPTHWQPLPTPPTDSEEK